MANIDNLKTITVLGSGVMGREIAQVALMGGFENVFLYSRSEETINKARKYIESGLEKLHSKNKLKEGFTPDLLMKRLHTVRDVGEAVKTTDFVIESVPEIMSLKQDIFKQLGELSPKHAILSTNTSTMSITQIAEHSGRPDKVIGMHFFTPIPLLRLIEIIKGQETSEETVEITLEVGKRLPAMKGKRFLPVIHKDRPGFIVNRLTIATNLYLSWLLDYAMDNNIPIEQVDADLGEVTYLGPYAKWDYFGIDTVSNVMKYFSETLSPEFAPGKTITKLLKEGNLGKKTGKGLFEWVDGKLELDKSKKAGLFNYELYMALQLNEGCRLLEEGVVKNYSDIDETMVAGMDMPGPFELGKDKYKEWIKLLEDFVERSGKQYAKPCETLKSGKFLEMEK